MWLLGGGLVSVTVRSGDTDGSGHQCGETDGSGHRCGEAHDYE